MVFSQPNYLDTQINNKFCWCYEVWTIKNYPKFGGGNYIHKSIEWLNNNKWKRNNRRVLSSQTITIYQHTHVVYNHRCCWAEQQVVVIWCEAVDGLRETSFRFWALYYSPASTTIQHGFLRNLECTCIHTHTRILRFNRFAAGNVNSKSLDWQRLPRGFGRVACVKPESCRYDLGPGAKFIF